MTNVLQHRGPDGSGHYWNQSGGWGAALGHRRLAIIDLALGRQPLSNEDGSVWITFNGEIYNYRELRNQLEAKGHTFRTRSDTETIVHLYEDEGVDCLRQLRGMFAFAIWDLRRRRLFLARDRLGQKPLVYRLENGRCLFASEIKAILQVPGVPREVDHTALNEYLTYLYVPHPRTIFVGINKLPPAHYAIYENGQLSVRRYWEPDYNAQLSGSADEFCERLRSELEEAVRLRLRSDVPLGVFLSGGIDSAVIAGLMQQHSARPVQTYTIGFPVEKYDETPLARATANHLNTNHHEFQIQSNSFEILPRLIWQYDEPFADSSAIPTYYVSKITREHVKVALSGDGGDELFGGYPRYETMRRVGLFDRLPGGLKRIIANPLWDCVPAPNRETSYLRRLRTRMRLLKQPPDKRYVNWVAHYQHGHRRSLYTEEFMTALETDQADDFFIAAIRRCTLPCAGTQAMVADLQTYLPCDLLTKVDIASMAHGLECRSPFLDHRVVELALTIPYYYKVHRKTTKWILKRTFGDLIPLSVLTARKRGFRIPLDDWFRNEHREYLREVLLDASSLRRGYFRRQNIETLIQEHTSGLWNHGERLWALLYLELWHRTFLDKPVVSSPVA